MATSSVTTRNLAGTGCTGIGQRKEVCTTSQDERQSHRNRRQHHFLCCTLMVSVKTLRAEQSLAHVDGGDLRYWLADGVRDSVGSGAR